MSKKLPNPIQYLYNAMYLIYTVLSTLSYLHYLIYTILSTLSYFIVPTSYIPSYRVCYTRKHNVCECRAIAITNNECYSNFMHIDHAHTCTCAKVQLPVMPPSVLLHARLLVNELLSHNRHASVLYQYYYINPTTVSTGIRSIS